MRLEFSHCYFGLSITTRATRNTITKRARKQREPRDQATHVVLFCVNIHSNTQFKHCHSHRPKCCLASAKIS